MYRTVQFICVTFRFPPDSVRVLLLCICKTLSVMIKRVVLIPGGFVMRQAGGKFSGGREIEEGDSSLHVHSPNNRMGKVINGTPLIKGV